MFPSQDEQTMETLPLRTWTCRINREFDEIASETCSICFDKNYEVLIPNRTDWIANNVVLNDEVVCFTDGSRLEHTGRTGASVFTESHTIKQLYHLGIMLLSFRQKCMLYGFVYRICVMK